MSSHSYVDPVSFRDKSHRTRENSIVLNNLIPNPFAYFCRICRPQSSCEKVNPATAVRDAATKTDPDAVDGRRNCLCDPSCGMYGDCCTDSQYFDAVEQQKAAAKYGCARTDGGGGSYVIVRCPAEWLDPRVRGLCETPGGVERDGMLGNPVTSRRTGLSYRNRFCAVCNGDTTDQIVWNTRLVCEDLTEVAAGSEQAVLDTLRYSADGGDSGHWVVEYLNQPYGCQLAADPPSAVAARPCLPNAVVACHPTWPDDDIRSNCEAYTMVVYNGARPYKNIHCAMCNHVPVQNLTCANTEIHIRFPGQFAPRSFTALFVAEPGHRKCLGPDTFYDPFGKTCRSLVPTGSDVPLNCSTVAMYPVVLPNWRPSEAAEYVMLDNGTMAVCVDVVADGNRYGDRTTSPSTEAFKSTTVTYVGLGVSMVFLLIHLSVFAVLPEMKNLSGKNLASFCFSLVCSYTAFVAGNWLTGPACYAGAALTHYLFLTSFAWMLVMSFDCWRTLRLATVELRITTGRQTKKFLVYSAVCWLVPAMMTFVAVAADAVPTVPDSVRPRFGADQCWFGSKTALLVFFAGPLAAVMAINFVLFIWTAYMIHSSRATVRHINTRHVRRDFRMYCRLAVLMGLTWMTGILASYIDNRYLWILFVVLNTFQGLFVFVAFTCRRRILNALIGRGGGFAGGGGGPRGHLGHINHIGHPKDLEKDNNNMNFRAPPPSFSWSSSENSSVPVSSEKTSDTLY